MVGHGGMAQLGGEAGVQMRLKDRGEGGAED